MPSNALMVLMLDGLVLIVSLFALNNMENKKIFGENLNIEEPTNINTGDFELDMIRANLLLDPKNKELTPDKIDKLVVQEFKEAHEED
jgi:hypothetical protein